MEIDGRVGDLTVLLFLLRYKKKTERFGYEDGRRRKEEKPGEEEKTKNEDPRRIGRSGGRCSAVAVAVAVAGKWKFPGPGQVLNRTEQVQLQGSSWARRQPAGTGTGQGQVPRVPFFMDRLEH